MKTGTAGAIPFGAGKGDVIDNGTLDLNGKTQTINGLSGGGTVTSSVAGAITLTVGADGSGGTFSGIIQNGAGTVSLTKTGGGTQILSGTNTYSGADDVSLGTLQLGDGSAANGLVLGNITDNAALIFADPFAQTFTGTISGSGSVSKTGAGMLTLNMANSYSGDTTISAGTLKEGVAGAIPSGAGKGNVIDNGTLDLNGIAQNGQWSLGQRHGDQQRGGRDCLHRRRQQCHQRLQRQDSERLGNVVADEDRQRAVGPQRRHVNSYTGGTTIYAGMLRAVDGVSLPTSGNLNVQGGVFEIAGASSFTRSLGTGSGQLQFSGTSGLSAYGTAGVTVNLGGAGATINWGSGGFNPSQFILGASTGNAPITLAQRARLERGRSNDRRQRQ